MGAAKKALGVVALGALVVVAGPIVGAALMPATVSTAVATAVGSGVITGGITALQGGSVSDVLRSAVIGGVTAGIGAEAAGSVQSSIAQAAKDAGYADVAASMSKVAAGATQGGVSAASRSVITGKGDPLEALLQGGISGGLGAGVMEGVNTATSNIDGFAKYDNATGKFTDQGDIPMAVQRATKAALASGALGGDPATAATNSIFQTVAKYAGDQIKDYGNDLKTAYQKAQDAAKAIEQNQTAQQKAVDDYQAKAKEVNDKYDAITQGTADFKTAKANWDDYPGYVARYEADLKAKGYTKTDDENGVQWTKQTGGHWETRPDTENGGTYQTYVADNPGTTDGEGNQLTPSSIKTETAPPPPSKDDLARTANAIAEKVNANIADYNKFRPEADKQLAAYKDQLTTLQTDLKTLDTNATTANKDLTAAVGTFQEGEAKNAAQVAQMVKDAEGAQITAKNELGIELTPEQLARAVQSGNIGQETAKIVAETNQASIDQGYEGFKDQTAAKANGIDDAKQWANFKNTSGIVDTGGDVNQVALGGQNKSTEVFTPDTYTPPADTGGGDTFNTTDNTAVDNNPPPDTTTVDNTPPADTNVATVDNNPPPAGPVDQLLTADNTDNLDLQSLLGLNQDSQTANDTAALTQGSKFGLTESELKDLGINDIAALTEGPKVTEAMAAPTGGSYDLTSTKRLSDIGPSNPDAGLASLISQQQGGTSATADDTGGLKTITENNLGTDQPAGNDYGSATFNALTGANTDRTIAENVLGKDKGDVTGGVESGGLYSGKKSEITPSDTLTNKYFSDAPQTSAEAENITTSADEAKGKKPEAPEAPTATETVLQPEKKQESESSLLPKLAAEEAKLFNVNDATPTKAVTEGKKMDETDVNNMSVEDLIARDQNNVQNNGGVDWGQFDQATNDYMTDRQQNGFMIDSTTKAYPNDDGTYRMVNLETGEESSASADQIQAMLNHDKSTSPDAMASLRGTPQTPPGWGTKLINAIGNGTTAALSNPKTLAALGGAALGAVSAKQATGITPQGLRSLQTGTGKQLTQTGAKGTGGKGSVRYFEKKAGGGTISKGGLGYLKSSHDGMADQINATIDNKRPAKLSGGEFVIPADVVSHLGNGNSEAGAQQLYALMERVRKARTGTSAQGKEINPKKYMPK